MIIHAEIDKIGADRSSIRGDIMDFESLLKEQPGASFGDSDMCPLKHSFSEGIYVREIFIPKGTILTGKIHKHSHPNFLMSGEVEVVTEYGGREKIKAPLSMISVAGTKRVVIALTDVVWVTVHANETNTNDLGRLEKMIIAPNYESYHKFIESQKSYISIVGKYIKRLLS